MAPFLTKQLLLELHPPRTPHLVPTICIRALERNLRRLQMRIGLVTQPRRDKGAIRDVQDVCPRQACSNKTAPSRRNWNFSASRAVGGSVTAVRSWNSAGSQQFRIAENFDPARVSARPWGANATLGKELSPFRSPRRWDPPATLARSTCGRGTAARSTKQREDCSQDPCIFFRSNMALTVPPRVPPFVCSLYSCSIFPKLNET